MSKDFTTAVVAEQREEDEEWIDFTINKSEPYFARYPTTAQLALYTAAFAEGATGSDTMNATLKFLQDIMYEPSYKDLIRRLRDRNDPVTLDTLQEILEFLFETVAARPTPPASTSSSSPKPGGQKSTAPTRPAASTRSRSRPPGSST